MQLSLCLIIYIYGVNTTTATFSSLQSVDVPDLNDQDHTPATGFYHLISAVRTARDEDRLLNINVTVQRQTDGTYKLIRQEGIEKAVTVNLIYAHPFVTGTLNLATTLSSLGNVVFNDRYSSIRSRSISDSWRRVIKIGSSCSAGDSRTDAAVAAGDRARYSLILQAQYDRRVSEEARRLMSLYGVKASFCRRCISNDTTFFIICHSTIRYSSALPIRLGDRKYNIDVS